MLPAALLAATGLAVSACAPTHDATRSQQTGLVVANLALNFGQELGAGFRTGVGQVSSVAPIISGPDIVDGNTELRMFQDEVGAGVGAAAVMTLDPDLFNDPIAATLTSGRPVIAVDNPPLPSSGVTLFIGSDNVALGAMLADQVASRLPPNVRGDIVVGTNSPGQLVLDDRVQGMLTEFHRRLPEARVLGPFDTQQDVGSNLKAWQSLVEANPHALAFVGTGDADGWNLAAIRKQTGSTWLAGGFDLDPRSLQAVRAGELLLVSPEHFAAGELAGHLLAEHTTQDDPLPAGWLVVPGLAVTPANIDQIMARQSSVADREAWFTPRVTSILENLDGNLRPYDQIR